MPSATFPIQQLGLSLCPFCEEGVSTSQEDFEPGILILSRLFRSCNFGTLNRLPHKLIPLLDIFLYCEFAYETEQSSLYRLDRCDIVFEPF